MAKKMLVNDQAFSPVKAGLVHAVVNQGPPLLTHHRSKDAVHAASRRIPDIVAQSEMMPEAERSRGKLTREKRVLITAREEIALNELVHRISRGGAMRVNLSHVLRACILLVHHCNRELVDRLRSAPDLTRPANSDASALARFDRRLAQEVAAAIRLAPPF